MSDKYLCIFRLDILIAFMCRKYLVYPTITHLLDIYQDLLAVLITLFNLAMCGVEPQYNETFSDNVVRHTPVLVLQTVGLQSSDHLQLSSNRSLGVERGQCGSTPEKLAPERHYCEDC